MKIVLLFVIAILLGIIITLIIMRDKYKELLIYISCRSKELLNKEKKYQMHDQDSLLYYVNREEYATFIENIAEKADKLCK